MQSTFFFMPKTQKDGEMMAGNNLTTTFKSNTSGFTKGVNDVINKLNDLNKKLVDNQYQQKECNKAISDSQKEIKSIKTAEQDREKRLETEKRRREELNKIITESQDKIDQLAKSKGEDGKLTKEQESLLKTLNKTIAKAQKELSTLTLTEEEKNRLDEEGKQKINDLNESIENQKVQLSQLRTEQAALKQSIADTSKNLAEENAAIEGNSNVIEDNNTKWAQLKEKLMDLGENGIQMVTQKLLDLGKTVISIGEQFTASMSSVGAISGANAEEMELLEQTARKFGSTTKYTASEAADALGYMALAGWDTNQSVSALGGVLNLAAASNMDLAEASDIVTDYITAFGLSAEDSARFVDMMSYAMSNSNTNTQQLGEAYKNCAASAASMGYSVEDVTAVLMTMANAGVKGGEAGTALNTVMTRLATNTKGCASELAEYGVEIYDAGGNMQSLSSILEGIAENWSGLTDQQQANLAKMIAGTNQYSSFQTIMSGLSEEAKKTGMSFGDYTQALEKCDGTATEMANTMSNNLTGDLKVMQSAFEELALKIYDDAEQPLRNIIQLITTKGVPALEEILNEMNWVLPVITASAAALGSLKIMSSIANMTKSLSSATQAATAATQAATAAQEGFNLALGANPVGMVITLITTLTTLLLTFCATTQNAADETDRLNESTIDYSDSIAKIQIGIEESIQKGKAQAETIRTLEDRYDELRAATSLTADEQAELDQVAEALADTLGKSVDDIKDQTGAYKDLSKEIDTYIEKLEKEVKFKANKEKLEEAYRVYYEILDKYKETSKELEEVNQQVKDFQNTDEYKEYSKKVQELNEQWGKGEISAEQYSSSLEDINSEYGGFEAKIQELQKTQQDYNTELSFAADAVVKCQTAMGAAAPEAERYDKLMHGAGESSDWMTQMLKGADSAFQSVSETITGSIDKEEELDSETKDLSEALKNLNPTVNSLKGSLKSLSETYQKVSAGQKLELDTIIDLVEQYPEFAEQLINAADSADKQKEAIKTLYEAKKEEYIKTKELQIEEQQLANDVNAATLALLGAMLATAEYGDNTEATQKRVAELKKSIAELTAELNNGKAAVEGYQKLIDKMRGVDVNAYIPSTSSDSNGGSSSSGGSEKTVYTTSGRGIEATGNTAADSRLKWLERAKNLYDLSLEEQIHYLNEILRNEVLTADEVYEVNYKLKQALDKQQEERTKKAEEEAKAREEAEKNTLWTTKGGGEEYTSKSKLDSQFGWLDRMKEFNKISLAAEKDYLNKILKEETLSVDERYQVRRRLLDVENDIAEQAKEQIKQAKEQVKEVTITYKNESYKAESYAKAALGALSQAKYFGKVSLQEERKYLQDLLKYDNLTNEERLEIRKLLYNADQSIAKEEAEAAKKVAVTWRGLTREGTSKLDAYFSLFDDLKKYDMLSLEEEYEQLRKLQANAKPGDFTKEEMLKLRQRGRAVKKELQSAAEEFYQNQLELVSAAYDKLIKNQTDAIEKQNKAVQKRYQNELDKLDEIKKKHDEINEDEKRQNELDKINAKLKYDRLDSLQRLELERKKQDILNDQAEADFERNIANQKITIQNQMTAAQEKTDAALAALQKNQTTLSDYIAKVTGTQTAAQQVAGNSILQNIQIVSNGLNEEQLAKKILKEVGVHFS